MDLGTPVDIDTGSSAFQAHRRKQRFAQWFGGDSVVVGARIVPVTAGTGIASDGSGPNKGDTETAYGDSTEVILSQQIAHEDGRAIQYRSCTWQKTASLLFSEYICLAIMSFPMSYSVLGMVPGLINTFVMATIVLYTSLILWQFCLRHPEVRDVCDIAHMLFGGSWAWYFTAVMFILNNTFIQSLHIVVGAQYLNIIAGKDVSIWCRNVSYGLITLLACFLFSLPRTFNKLSHVATLSAAFTFVSVLLAVIFSGLQPHPAGYARDMGMPKVSAWPLPGTGFIAGMNAFLNVCYVFVGQITLPSFIAEMKDPREFPKALWLCTIGEVAVFSVVGAAVYSFVGSQYMTSPAFGSLQDTYKKISFSFMVPTIIFVGSLYASVSARFVQFRIFRNTRHLNDHTVAGWTTWVIILLVLWIIAFVIAEVIPFFSSLLSIMGSLFDCFFGFLFWGVAYFRMRHAGQRGGAAEGKPVSMTEWASIAVNIVIILIGILFLTAGTYASVEGVIGEFKKGGSAGPFACHRHQL